MTLGHLDASIQDAGNKRPRADLAGYRELLAAGDDPSLFLSCSKFSENLSRT